MLAYLVLLELIILLVLAARMSNREPMNQRSLSRPPRLSTPTTPVPVLTKSQANTQALLRWQHCFDLLEENANGTPGTGRGQESEGL